MLLPRKWSLYFCAFLATMCPRRSRILATSENEKNVYENSNVNLEISTNLPLKGETSISYGNLEIAEPGFEFTAEEMQKLKIWPGGVIPYFIDDYSFDKVLRDRLRAFLDHTNTVAGVQFSELSQAPEDDSRWVFFINRRGVLPCEDLDFRKFNSSGVQKVVIGYDCMEPGNLAEICLALAGVPPQHNSPNRDEYVSVETKNILPGKEHLFEKFSDTEWLFHDVDYDFTSVGHYGYHKYTANGGATLKPLKAVDVRTGEATAYSFNDIWKMRMLYNYISKRNRISEDNTKSCSKLFKPGAKFAEFLPNEDEEDVVKPRPKPSKYTGIPEEKIREPDNDDDGDDGDQNKENTYKNEGGNDMADEEDEEDRINEKHRTGPAKLKNPEKKARAKKERNGLYLSDFQTD